MRAAPGAGRPRGRAARSPRSSRSGRRRPPARSRAARRAGEADRGGPGMSGVAGGCARPTAARLHSGDRERGRRQEAARPGRSERQRPPGRGSISSTGAGRPPCRRRGPTHHRDVGAHGACRNDGSQPPVLLIDHARIGVGDDRQHQRGAEAPARRGQRAERHTDSEPPAGGGGLHERSVSGSPRRAQSRRAAHAVPIALPSRRPNGAALRRAARAPPASPRPASGPSRARGRRASAARGRRRARAGSATSPRRRPPMAITPSRLLGLEQLGHVLADAAVQRGQLGGDLRRAARGGEELEVQRHEGRVALDHVLERAHQHVSRSSAVRAAAIARRARPAAGRSRAARPRRAAAPWCRSSSAAARARRPPRARRGRTSSPRRRARPTEARIASTMRCALSPLRAAAASTRADASWPSSQRLGAPAARLPHWQAMRGALLVLVLIAAGAVLVPASVADSPRARGRRRRSSPARSATSAPSRARGDAEQHRRRDHRRGLGHGGRRGRGDRPRLARRRAGHRARRGARAPDRPLRRARDRHGRPPHRDGDGRRRRLRGPHRRPEGRGPPDRRHPHAEPVHALRRRLGRRQQGHAPRSASRSAPPAATLPAGTTVDIAVARASADDAVVATPTADADAATATPDAEAQGEGQGKRRKAPKVRERLTGQRYAFPVYGKATVADDCGAARAETGAHQGNDVFAQFGAPVLAVADGVVEKVGTLPISGNRLWLRTTAGDEFFYAHLSAFSPDAVNGRQRQGRHRARLHRQHRRRRADPAARALRDPPRRQGRDRPACDPARMAGEPRRAPGAWLARHGADTAQRPGALVEVRDFIAGE